jgi:hypothetical protein
VSPPDGFRTGPVGVLNITIFDPDRNRNISSSDSISFIIRKWDGSTLTFTATETGSNTGYFTALVDKSQIGSQADLLRCGVIKIVYSDPFTPVGPMSVVATVRFSSVDAQVRLDKSFYLPGQLITITVIDNDSVTNPSIIETITVTVTSTSDPLGVVGNTSAYCGVGVDLGVGDPDGVSLQQRERHRKARGGEGRLRRRL